MCVFLMSNGKFLEKSTSDKEHFFILGKKINFCIKRSKMILRDPKWYQMIKNSIGDGGSTALYTVYTVFTVFTVNTVNTIY